MAEKNYVNSITSTKHNKKQKACRISQSQLTYLDFISLLVLLTTELASIKMSSQLI